MYIQCKFSLNWNDSLQFLFYVEIPKSIQSSENEQYDESCKISLQICFDSRRGQNLKMQFQGAL